MIFELISGFVKMANVLVCLALVIMVLVVKLQSKPIIKTIEKPVIILILILFVTLNISLFFDTNMDGFIILLSLIILLYFVRLRSKMNKELLNYNSMPAQDDALVLSQAKEQERSRIYANLHDDVGAKLLELIYKSKDEESKKLAKEVLNKMRQAVASTENIQCTVEQLVESLIHEAELRLDASNIKLVKKLKIDDPQQKIKTTIPMTLMRIIREVLSNVIKHAQANQVEFVITNKKDQLQIKISDDGKGFEKSSNKSIRTGKGLNTINKRAKSILATVTIESKSGIGTTFELKYNYAHK